jgi:uracil-DNA glycosylase
MALREPPRLAALLKSIRSCRHCVTEADGAPLPHEPRPTLRVSSTARLLVAGQAPGNLVHRTGIPFNDPSGDRLRQWMGVDRETFYDVSRIAIVPMGFCFPGYDKSGGALAPRRECRDKWHAQLFELTPQFDTVLAIGRYAQDYHLSRLGFARRAGESVADVVSNWRSYAGRTPLVIPLPHPSWRNTGWLKRNPWFEAELLPVLREEVARSISDETPPARARASRHAMLIRNHDDR